MKIEMARLCVAALATALISGCASSSHGNGGEEKMSLDKAPPPVQTSVQRLAGNNKVHSFTREIENGQTVYEAEWDQDGAEHSAVVNGSGDVMEEETEIKTSDLPPAVKDAVMKKYPNGHLGEAGSLREGGRSGYEVEVKTGAEKHELKVSPTGEILSDKTEHEKAGADKDHDNDKD
jgi:uncharacterized membrane protein YkoI